MSLTPSEERAVLERAAKVIRKILEGIYEEHTSCYDPDTGTTEISNSRIEDRANELEEIEEAIRSLPLESKESDAVEYRELAQAVIDGTATVAQAEQVIDLLDLHPQQPCPKCAELEQLFVEVRNKHQAEFLRAEAAEAKCADKERDRQYHMDAINRLASFLALSGTSFEVVQAAMDNMTRLATQKQAAESSLAELQQQLAEAKKDAERYQQLLDDPATGRHLLLLLSEGRGDQASFRKMQDRIKASKDAAMQGDNGGS